MWGQTFDIYIYRIVGPVGNATRCFVVLYIHHETQHGVSDAASRSILHVIGWWGNGREICFFLYTFRSAEDSPRFTELHTGNAEPS